MADALPWPDRPQDDLPWEDAVAAIEAADVVALACHLGPDGDALGSALAVGLALHDLGRKVVVSFGSDPFILPPAYSFLPGLELLVPPGEFPTAPAVLVTFDTGSVDRLGSLAAVAGDARVVVNVDHHASNTRFGHVNLVDEAAAASAVLALGLVDRLGATLTPEIATCVYTGLSTDTGSFKFASVTPEVHELAARLLATGIRHDLISRVLWDTNRFGYLKVLGLLLERAVLESDLVWTWSTTADLAAHGVLLEEIEGVIDVLRTAAEAEVAVVCKGWSDGSFKVSMRSKGAVDVSEICVALGGGGHRFAAGYTSLDPLEVTVATLRAAVAAARRLPG